MGCLGSRVDPAYARYLPGRIATAIVGAVERLAPARIGWAQADITSIPSTAAGSVDQTDCSPILLARRMCAQTCIPAIKAPMSPDRAGRWIRNSPSWPCRCLEGKPLAVFANYSMHYYGSPLLSSDYYGAFAQEVGTMLGAEAGFVA
jgi:hypothetical protein